MIVLDELYTSPEALEFLEASQTPVLDNAPARALVAQGARLNIVADDAGKTEPPAAADTTAAATSEPTGTTAPATSEPTGTAATTGTTAATGTAAAASDATIEPAPQRVVAFSEMHLDAAKRYCCPEAREAIALCKDKAALRRALAPLYPDYFFREIAPADLASIDADALPYPLVLKPSTGFFSLGIYPLFNAKDWCAALADIERSSADWEGRYNASVVNAANFILESYIEGQEYALDAYFDHDGKPVVLNVLKHDFAGTDDTSDRLYYTSKRVIEEQLEPMTRFLVACNEHLGFRDFPLHPEVRVQPDGTIIPIEFNPGRFAGLCSTDLAYFAWGFKTYDYFLRDAAPDWDELLAGKEGLAYPAILLTPSRPGDEERGFDYDKLASRFSRVLNIRRNDVKRLGLFGTAFLEVRDEDWGREVVPLLSDDLSDYLI